MPELRGGMDYGQLGETFAGKAQLPAIGSFLSKIRG